MCTTRFIAASALCLTLVLVATAQQATPTDQLRPAVAAILKLSNNLNATDVSAQAKKIVEDYDSCDISQVFIHKGPRRGGLGIGTAVKAGYTDSIGALVRDWAGPRPPTKAVLQAHQKDLLQVARVLQAMAELAPFRNPFAAVANAKDRKTDEWRKVAADFKVVTRRFRDSIQEGEPTTVRKVAVRLEKTCNACHALVGL
jgi:hypothetical protein